MLFRVLLSALTLILCASPPGDALWLKVRVGAPPAVVQTITAVGPTSGSYTSGAAPGTVIAPISVTMSPATPAFVGTLTLSGGAAVNFSLDSSTLPANLITNADGSTPTCTSNTDYTFNIVATQAGATGSPFTQPVTITCTPPAQSIASVSPSSAAYSSGISSGATVAAIAVAMNPTLPAFSGTLSLTGANAADFSLSSTTLPSNLTANGSTPTCGSITTLNLNIVATQSGATGSPFTQAVTVTCNPQSIASVSPSSTNYISGIASGAAITAIGVTMSPASPTFAGTLSLTGVNAGDFSLSSTTLPSNLLANSATPTCTTATPITGINIVATQAGATGSPATQALTVTCNPASAGAVALDRTINNASSSVTVPVSTGTPAFWTLAQPFRSAAQVNQETGIAIADVPAGNVLTATLGGDPNVRVAACNANGNMPATTGYISGTTFTATSVPTGTLITPGTLLVGSGVSSGTYVTGVGAGGGAGAYPVSISQTAGSSGSPISISINPGGVLVHADGSTRWSRLLLDFSNVVTPVPTSGSADLVFTPTPGTWSTTSSVGVGGYQSLADTVVLTTLSGATVGSMAGTWTADFSSTGTAYQTTVICNTNLGSMYEVKANFKNGSTTFASACSCSATLSAVMDYWVTQTSSGSQGPVASQGPFIENLQVLNTSHPQAFTADLTFYRGGVQQRAYPATSFYGGTSGIAMRTDGQWDWSSNDPGIYVTQDYTKLVATQAVPPYVNGITYTGGNGSTGGPAGTPGLPSIAIATESSGVFSVASGLGIYDPVWHPATAIQFTGSLGGLSGISLNTTYFLCVLPSNVKTFQIYDTYAHAMANYTSNGTAACPTTGKITPTGTYSSGMSANMVVAPDHSGIWQKYMGSPSSRPDLSWMSEWGTAYVVGNTAAWQKLARVQAYAMWGVPTWMLSATTGCVPNMLNTVSSAGTNCAGGTGLGSAHTTTEWVDGKTVSSDINGGVLPAGYQTSVWGIGGVQIEASHWFGNVVYPVYLLEGSPYLGDLLQQDGNEAIYNHLPSGRNFQLQGTGTIYYGAILTSCYAGITRRCAWLNRDLSNAMFFAPEGSAEQAYYRTAEGNSVDALLAYWTFENWTWHGVENNDNSGSGPINEAPYHNAYMGSYNTFSLQMNSANNGEFNADITTAASLIGDLLQQVYTSYPSTPNCYWCDAYTWGIFNNDIAPSGGASPPMTQVSSLSQVGLYPGSETNFNYNYTNGQITAIPGGMTTYAYNGYAGSFQAGPAVGDLFRPQNWGADGTTLNGNLFFTGHIDNGTAGQPGTTLTVTTISDNFLTIGTPLSIAASSAGTFTGCIGDPTCTTSGSTLVVSTISSNFLLPGMSVSGTGITGPPEVITSQLTGTTGGVGTYAVSIAAAIASETLTAHTPGIASVVGTLTGTISGTTFTVSAIPAGNFLLGGSVQSIAGTGITGTPKIVSQLTGTTGGVGTYTISTSQTVPSAETITVSNVNATTKIASQISGTTGGLGTYSLNTSQTVLAGASIDDSLATVGAPDQLTDGQSHCVASAPSLNVFTVYQDPTGACSGPTFTSFTVNGFNANMFNGGGWLTPNGQSPPSSGMIQSAMNSPDSYNMWNLASLGLMTANGISGAGTAYNNGGARVTGGTGTIEQIIAQISSQEAAWSLKPQWYP